MKPQAIFLLFAACLLTASSPALATHAPVERVLYQCKLHQKVPGYNEEDLAGYIAPTDMRDPAPGVRFVYPNIHLSRGHGVEGIVYGFHDQGKPGVRLLLQIFDGKDDKANAYEVDPTSMSVSYVRERDQALFELSCIRI